MALNIDENILRSVECPVCYSTMLPPVMTCKIGHSICNFCLLKLLSCPMCKQPMTTIRNYSLETILENIVIPCKNSSSGCTYVERGSKAILKHLEVCDFRPRKCPFFTYNQIQCGWEGPFLDMEKHILVCKFPNVVKNPINFPLLSISNKHFCRLVIVAFNQIFLFSVRNDRGNFKFQTNIISKESEEFQYVLTIKKKGQNLNKFKENVTYTSDYSDEMVDPKKSKEFRITENHFYTIFCKLEILSTTS